MKNIKIVSITTYMIWLFSLILFSSCSNDDDKSNGGIGSPKITSVMPSGYDEDGVLKELTPVTIGDPKNYYIIRGTALATVEKIYFNGFDTYFNPTLVTDTNIVVLINENTPYANASNTLKIVTKYGTTEIPFTTAPPTPTFSGFNPINANEGDLVTIKGKYFLDPTVTIAATPTEPAIPVTIVSSTLEKIVVKLPANTKFRKLSVTNISGTATSVEAIGTALYDDQLYGMQWGGPWAGKGVNFDFDGDKYQGEKSWQWIHGAWDGGNWGFDIDMAPYKALRIAVKGSKTGQVNFNVNGGPNYTIPVTTLWTYMEIPLSSLGNPSSVSTITFQESNSDGGNTVLYDDIGFVLK